MEIRTIHNKKEYKAALDEIEQLWTAPAKFAKYKATVSNCPFEMRLHVECDVITVKPVAHRLLVHPNLLGHLCIGVAQGTDDQPI